MFTKSRNTTFAVLLYSYFWVIPRCLYFIWRRFGTLCSIFIGGVLTPPMNKEQSVPKRRHTKFRRGGITQKYEYNIQNTAKVWNQEFTVLSLHLVKTASGCSHCVIRGGADRRPHYTYCWLPAFEELRDSTGIFLFNQVSLRQALNSL